jgi:serine/threonine-protein kinase
VPEQGGAPLIWSSKTTAISEEDRAFLQRRVAIFAAIVGAIGIAFGVQRVLQAMSIGTTDTLWTASLLLHLVGVASMVLLLALTSFGRRSARFIRIAEIICISTSLIAFIVMAAEMPQVFRPNFSMLLGAMAFLLVRSIWVPSTWRLTALVCVIVGIPLLLTVWQRYEVIDPAVLAAFADHDDFFEVTPRNIRIDNLVLTAMWFTITSVIASAASGVIYGLRRDVRKARRLGQYVLEEKLGEGGMGVVYRAHHAMLRRPTAIKLLRHDGFGEESLARFEREVRLTAKLTHPNTVTVFDYGRTPDGIFYYAMELLDGASLQEIVPLVGAQPPDRVAHILAQVAGALSEAHAVGLIHRDIKPANIMLCRQGGVPDVAKVLDFGLVKDVGDVGPSMTQAGVVKGTPYYMSPEAISAPDTVDARSDLYALGAVGYYLLTGQLLFAGKTSMEVCLQHIQSEPTPPSERLGEPVPASLETVILDCLAKDPAERPQSALDLQARLHDCEGVGPWDGTWWWEEYGEAMEMRRREVSSTPSGLTLDIGLAERRHS